MFPESAVIPSEIEQIKDFAGASYTEHDDMIDALADAVENITENITFMASFSANQYDVVSGINDDDLGEVTLISDSYDCGSEIELEVKPIDGYRLEGWYLNNELYAEDEKITFIVPSFDCEIIAKVVIKTFTGQLSERNEEFLLGCL